MIESASVPDTAPPITAALRVPLFRLIWGASVLSNLGLIIQGVAAAWTMTQMSSDATLVAMVQSATLLPMAIFTLPAGAMADIYSRRLIALSSLTISLVGIATLLGLALADGLTPAALLALSFVAGCGMALFWPVWQSSAGDDVPAEWLASAIGLNSLSYNGARVLGPAIGGAIVAAGGAVIAFAVSGLLYLPMILAQLSVRTIRKTSLLPPETMRRALISGVRYVTNSPAIMSIVLRSLIMGSLGGALHALMPLISHDLLGAGARTFGFLLGAFGAGAILGIVFTPRLRRRYGANGSAWRCTLALGVSQAVIGVSHSALLSGLALLVAGATWMGFSQACNVSLQMLVPRWVAGRAVACFQASLSGGVVLAGVGWGLCADQVGVGPSLLISGLLVVVSIATNRIWPLPDVSSAPVGSGDSLPSPFIDTPVTGKNGPILVEIEYRVSQEDACPFYQLIEQVQSCLKRNGAYDVSVSRDLGNSELWTVRYHFPTWDDYLRQRDRMTAQERALQQQQAAFHRGDTPVRVRRFLEQPFGSVR